MKECPFCKEDNMSKAVYCCMCGKEFPQENSEAGPARRFVAFGNEEKPQPAETKTNRRFAAFGGDDSQSTQEESKPASRFKRM